MRDNQSEEVKFSALTDEELRASLASCDESMIQIKLGLGMTVEEARQKTIAGLRAREM